MMTHTWLPILLLLSLALCIGQLRAAPILCGGDEQADAKSGEVSGSTPKPSEVNQFLHNVQCTLEKAKPWIEDLETEAKRLEETAKRVGLSIVHRFGSLMESLLGTAAHRIPSADAGGSPTTTTTTTTTTATPSGNNDSDSVATSAVELVEQVEQVTRSTTSPIDGLAPNEADNEIANGEPLK